MIQLVFRRAVHRLSALPLLFFIFLLLIGAASAAVAPQPGDFRGCPEAGQGGDPDLNRLKNRSAEVQTPEPMTVAQINVLPLPLEALSGRRATWPARTAAEVSALEGKGVAVESFLIAVKQQGPETTNCKRQELRDYHLWIVDAKDQTRAQSVVAEVTPRWLAANHGWRLRFLKRLAHARPGPSRSDRQDAGWALGDPSGDQDRGVLRRKLD